MRHYPYKLFLTGLVLCYVLAACSKRDRFLKDFKILNLSTTIQPGADQKDRVHKLKAERLLDAETFIKFNKDGTFSALNQEGIYGKGTWQFNEDLEMQWMLPKLPSMLLKVTEAKDDETGTYFLSLKSQPFGKCELSMLLKEDSFYQNEDVDLVSDAYNWWRIKPSKKESKEEIKKRVLAQLEFMAQYFKLTDDKELGEFYVTHLQSPLEFYSNGIGLKDTNADLLELYYDENDAYVAKKFLADGIKSLSVYPADTKTFTKGYYNALKQMSKAISLM